MYLWPRRGPWHRFRRSFQPSVGALFVPNSRSRRLAVSVLIAILTVLALTPGTVAAAGGTGFVGMANEYRADAELGPVAYHSAINAIAAERGRQIADDRALGHDFDYLRRRFAEEGICWRGFGEIVARNGSGDFSAFGTQWFNSTTHRNVMRGDYTHASGSRESAGGQLVWRHGVREDLQRAPLRSDHERLHRSGHLEVHRRHRVARRAGDHVRLRCAAILPALCGVARRHGNLPRARLRRAGSERRLLHRR